jgi:uncharacterized protein
MSADTVVYLDSSAVVKLVVEEAESDALRAFLAHRSERVTCSLARTEVVRAVAFLGEVAVRRALVILAGFDLIGMNDALLDDAGRLNPPTLRSLDAIHLASARLVGPSLETVVTYDQRMAAAAGGLGLPTFAPS